MPFVRDEAGLFQSSPAIAGGRDLNAVDISIAFIRFNPRPPLLAGAMVALVAVAVVYAQFQSSPAIAGGRDH